MSQEKTEEPTAKKLRQARKKGEVARSRVLVAGISLVAIGGVAHGVAVGALDTLAAVVQLALSVAANPARHAPGAVLEACVGMGMQAAAPLLLTAVAVGALASFVQVGPLFTVAGFAPKPERLDPIKGMKNLVSQRRLVDLASAMVTLTIVMVTVWVVLRAELRGVAGLPARDAASALAAIGALLGALTLRVGGVVTGLGVLDLVYQRWRFSKDQRMTKEEVKREQKEAEGDPQDKQNRKRAHREIVEHGTLEEVRRADVLVVNPTHIAVALLYDEEAGADAPEVLARGGDHLARRMIAAAQEAGVPVLRDVPLARSLFELEVGEVIPEGLYDAVAAVLRAAYGQREETQPGETQLGETQRDPRAPR